MIRTVSPPEQRFVFYGVTWEEYEGLLRAFADRRLRHTRSLVFSFLAAKDLTRFMAMRETKDDTELELLFEKWLRSRLAKKRKQ